MGNFDKKYSSEIESVKLFEDDFGSFLKGQKMSAKKVFSILMSVSEAFNNALVHGNKFDCSKLIAVNINVNENSLTADIIDEGIDGIKKIKSRQSPGMHAESGRGINLIEHFSSEVKYEEERNGGLKISITFDLAQVPQLREL